MYHEVNSIREKDEFEMQLTSSIMEPNFTTDTPEGLRLFLKDLVGFYVIMEGIFFYSGFAMLLKFKSMNKMVGIGQQFEYIMRDESIHLNFGIELINGIRDENPGIWTPEFEAEIRTMINHAVELEICYAQDCMPRGILGLNSALFRDYVQYIADRRFERLKMEPQYGSKNPFPWMSEQMDLSKEQNFFEKRVTEYSKASLLEW
jgi:ribonucleoside-diphosphate reductase beta chain